MKLKQIISLVLLSSLVGCTADNNELTGNLSVTFFDVGQADCSLIEQGDTHILVDAGNDADGPLIVQTLLDMGINQLDAMIITHPHEDHLGGADDVIDALKVSEVIGFYYDTKSEYYLDLIKRMEENQLTFTQVNPMQTVDINGLNVKILHVDPNNKDVNDSSIAFRLDYKDVGFFFGGDISNEVAEDLTLFVNGIDVYKANHHGSRYSNSDIFLTVMSPDITIMSCGKNNQYGFPHDEVMETLKWLDSEVMQTDIDGFIECDSDGSEVACTALDNKYPLTNEYIIGNKNSKIYHSSTCTKLPEKRNAIELYSTQAAQLLGYQPHQQCMN